MTAVAIRSSLSEVFRMVFQNLEEHFAIEALVGEGGDEFSFRLAVLLFGRSRDRSYNFALSSSVPAVCFEGWQARFLAEVITTNNRVITGVAINNKALRGAGF